MSSTLTYRTLGANCPIEGSHYVTLPNDTLPLTNVYVYVDLNCNVVWSDTVPDPNQTFGSSEAPEPAEPEPEGEET